MKAISPVIATVIIVAVAIALAIAVALWITGVIGGVSRFERLDITAAYVQNASHVAGDTFYQLRLEVSNKGSSTVTIDKVFVNNVPIPDQDPAAGVAACWQTQTTLNPGQSTTLYVYLNHKNYSSGQVIQIIVHTATGGQYPTQVTLP